MMKPSQIASYCVAVAMASTMFLVGLLAQDQSSPVPVNSDQKSSDDQKSPSPADNKKDSPVPVEQESSDTGTGVKPSGRNVETPANQIFQLLLEEQLLLSELGPKHPKVRAIQKKIELTQDFYSSEMKGLKKIDPRQPYAQARKFLQNVEEKLRLGINTEESRRLSEEIVKLEAEAMSLAATIRMVSKGGPTDSSRLERDSKWQKIQFQSPAGMQSMSITPRKSGDSMKISHQVSQNTTPPENVTLIHGGVNIVVEGSREKGDQNTSVIDLSADRIVIWTDLTVLLQSPNGYLRTGSNSVVNNLYVVRDHEYPNRPFEIYLEGNVIIRHTEGAQVKTNVRGTIAFYDARTLRVCVRDQEFTGETSVADDDMLARSRAVRDTSSVRQQNLTQTRRELDVTLSKAFDLKSQLEQLRVRELQSRLSRLEQQIGRRQDQSKQIIERRARELIDGDETQWNSEPSVEQPSDAWGNPRSPAAVIRPLAGHPSATDSMHPFDVKQATRDLGNASDRAIPKYSFATVVEQLTPSVVGIVVTKTFTNKENKESRAYQVSGSGVILRSPKAEGFFVVTNSQFIERKPVNSFSIQLHDGRMINPEKIWTDRESGIGVMKIDGRRIQSAEWGDSRAIAVGDKILLMGSVPQFKVAFGNITARGMRNLKVESSIINQDFIQTNVQMLSGNSGGPLIDSQGNVIGINMAVTDKNNGMCLSISSSLAQQIVDQLLEFGIVRRAWIGVKLDEVFGASVADKLNLDRVRGTHVREVFPNSPASRADLRAGDVILEFNGIEVEDHDHLINLVSLSPIGTQIQMTVWRGKKTIPLSIILADRSGIQKPGNGGQNSIENAPIDVDNKSSDKAGEVPDAAPVDNPNVDHPNSPTPGVSVEWFKDKAEDASAKPQAKQSNQEASRNQPSYKELANSFVEARHELNSAKAELAGVEVLYKSKVISQEEFDKARRRSELAQSKWKILKDDYEALLTDTEFQLKSAYAEMDSARRSHDALAEGFKRGSVSKRELMKEELRLEQAEIPVRRIKARYDLYKKAGILLEDEPKVQNPDVPTEPKKE